MATLRDIRNRIAGITSIEKITSAMKMVSSIKLRRAQKLVESARPYHKEISEMLANLVDSQENSASKIIASKSASICAKKKLENADKNYKNPLLEAKNSAINNVVIIVIAGDKGMCGSFNHNLFRNIDSYLRDEFRLIYPEAKPHLILVGTKSVDHYKKMDFDILGKFEHSFQHLEFSLVDEIRSLFIDDFLSGNVDKVEIYFNNFVNVMKQIPTKLQLLPILLEKKSTNSSENIKEKENIKENIPDYIFEPDKKTILDTLIWQYLGLNIWNPLLESNAAEQSARLIAMDKATQNANDLIKDLNLQYNNARQAAITTEMLEIVGGAESLRK